VREVSVREINEMRMELENRRIPGHPRTSQDTETNDSSFVVKRILSKMNVMKSTR